MLTDATVVEHDVRHWEDIGENPVVTEDEGGVTFCWYTSAVIKRRLTYPWAAIVLREVTYR